MNIDFLIFLQQGTGVQTIRTIILDYIKLLYVRRYIFMRTNKIQAIFIIMQLIASSNGMYFVESKYKPKYFVALKRRDKIEKNEKIEKKTEKKTKKSDRENGKKIIIWTACPTLGRGFSLMTDKKSIATQNKMPNRKFDAEM